MRKQYKKNILSLIFLVLFNGVTYAKDFLTVTHAFFDPFIWADDGVSQGVYVDVLHRSYRKTFGNSGPI